MSLQLRHTLVVGWMFAAARGTGAIVVLTPSGDLVRTIPAGARPNGLAWDPLHRHLLVADVQEHQARIVDPVAGQVMATTQPSGRVLDFFLTEEGRSMSGQRLRYLRVSSVYQHADRQVLDRTFTDHASGKGAHRPQLDLLHGFASKGHTVAVHSTDRLARNLDDLRRIVQSLTTRDVRIEFVKEGLVVTGEDSPMAHLMLSVMDPSRSLSGR